MGASTDTGSARQSTPEVAESAPQSPDATAGSSSWAGSSVAVIAATAVLALVMGTLLGWLVFGRATPGDDSVAAGFARDMTEHHAQAVEMSLQVLQTTDDDGVRTLATDIASTQGNQMGQMEGWIRTWELPMARPGDRMEWMADLGGHDHAAMEDMTAEGAAMPGMAAPAQMEQLRGATGEEADVLYLQLMITHHIAGIDMAQAALEGGVDDEVRRLAAAMVNGQESEITLMTDMLHSLGAQTQEESGEHSGH